MNLTRSLAALRNVWKDDQAFHAAGRPFGWYLSAHYVARFRDRMGLPAPWRNVTFRIEGIDQTYRLTFEHLGAAKGVVLDREYACVKRLGPMLTRVMDLGGNIGMGSGYISALHPRAEFAVVEPDPRNIGVLEDNLATNGVKCRVFSAAAGPSAGRLRLRMGPNPSCSALETSTLHDLVDGMEVEVITIPWLLDAMGWDRVDLLKIDIEGAEENLLRENNGWLDRVGAIVMEIHPNTTPERIASYLAPFGFVLERTGHGREPVYLATRN